MTQVLVEGGGILGAALLRARLVDELQWFVAPLLLGGDAMPSLGELGLTVLADSPRLDGKVRRVGGDMYIQGPIRYFADRGGRTVRRGAGL